MDTERQLPSGSWTTPLAALAAGFAAVSLIYLPDIGHGFIRDDFMWIRVGRLGSFSDLPRVMATHVGFYRPVVLLTFGLNHALSGDAAFPYALTNLLLLFACAVVLVRLAIALRLTPAAGVAAAVIWMLNFRAVGMALLWLSGRTALLLSLFGALAALATIRGRRWQAAAWCFLALLSKEEAVAFPFVLAAWTWFLDDGDGASRLRLVARTTWPMFAVLGVYAALRLHSGAFGPMTAPPYYQLTTSLPLLARNFAEYLDRSSTVAAAVVLLVAVAARQTPSLTRAESNAIALGLMWLAAGFAITLFLPVRSDLYALNPSLGAALCAGAAIQSLGRTAPVATRRSLVVAMILPFVLVPIYRARNVRWVAPANASAHLVSDIRHQATTLPDGTHLVIVDSPADGWPLRSAFGGLLPDALAIAVGRGFTGEVVDDVPNAPSSNGAPVTILAFRAGSLERLGAP